MRYLIDFAIFLLVVQFNQGLSNKEIIKIPIGEFVYFDVSTPKWSKPLKCIVNHNDAIYSIYPVYNLTNNGHVMRSYNVECSFFLENVSFDHAGIWTHQSTWKNYNNQIVKNSTVFELNVFEKMVSLPTNMLKTDDGNYVTVFPQYVFENLTNCTLIHHHDKMPTEKYNLLDINQTNLGIELYGKCGARLFVNESRYNGLWSIIHDNGPYIMKQLDFKIYRLDENDSSDEINLSWTNGASEEIRFTKYYKVIYCTIMQPDGQVTVIQHNYCAKQIHKVRKIHEGLWEIRYALAGEIGYKKKKYNVKVVDDFKIRSINVTINAINSQAVHLLCTLPGVELNFCTFIKPDGTVLNLPQETASNKYEYYGKGYTYKISQKNYSDCGLTIRSPSADDFGLWECSFGRNEDRYRAFVSFIDTGTINTIGAYVPNNVYVKRGDNLTLECPRYTPIKYCQLNHKYKLRRDSKSISFPGETRGLAAGICKIIVQNVNYLYAGNWSCILGAVGGGEINVLNAIIVTVTNSYLHPNKSVIKIDKDKKLTLTCNLLPEKYTTINYCRWRRPDGHRIHIENFGQYSSSYEQKSCSLTINEYNVVNIGIWTCYANLFSNSNEEISNNELSANITVIENNLLK